MNDADLDGDGITTCAGDCNEDLTVIDGFGTVGELTYPGAAYNETDPTVCSTDIDGDGYAGRVLSDVLIWCFRTLGVMVGTGILWYSMKMELRRFQQH